MKVALIGASGFVGNAVLEELLRRGHQVTGIVRHPEKVKTAAGVTAVKADALHENEVAEAVKGHDAVVSAYNPGWTNPDIYQEFIRGSRAILNGVKASGVKRLLVVGGAGSLFIAPGTQLIDTPEFPAEWKPGALGARDFLNIIKEEQQLEWTFLSPAIQMHPGTSGQRRGTYRSGLENPVFDEQGNSVISVEDMAIAIVDELEHPKHIRRRFTVAY
jgi:uncharacterized protein